MKIDEIVTTNFGTVFEKKLLQEICANGILKNADPEKIILEIRREILFIPLIISGNVKVSRRDGQGNGLFLHYLGKNQTSAIAITYGVENKKSDIRLETETAVLYIAIPIKVVDLWFEKYQSWRSFYFKLNQVQTALIIERINDIAFLDLEARLMKYLEYKGLVTNNNVIAVKHFDLARDLKASRESVSRILKKLEKEEVLALGRNKIILN